MKHTTLILSLLFLVPPYAFAADPSVASFIAGSYSLNSGQSASFSWNVANAGGYSFVVPCTVGIKFKKTDGSVFPCNTPVSSVLTSIDGIDLSVWNLSGFSKSFTARVIPKDASGVDFINTRKDIQVAVAPVTKPIESITGATSVLSVTPYTLSWTGSLIDGVNLSISCSSTIRTTSTSYPQGDIPCNTPLFAGGLPASGSIILSFNNSDIASQNITLTLTPMMAPGVYNGAQTESVTVSVNSNVASNALVTSFTAIASPNLERTPEGTPIPLSWTTTASAGANFRLSCNEHIIATIATDSASSTPKCATLAFTSALPANGAATILFRNDSFAAEPVTVTLVPARTEGGFDATKGREITFRILPKGASVNAPENATESPNITPRSLADTHAEATSVSKKTFIKNLARGSQGPDVRALQEFLKKDSAVYPEGIVNGTFGPATERAVKRFQLKYKVASAGTPGYGNVGPKTRELLNSLNQ